MEKALDNIFKFLEANRIYNKELQTRYYSGILKSQTNTADKVINLSYRTANTQSRPKIDNLAEFYRLLHQNQGFLYSFSGFMQVIDPSESEPKNYHGLFKSMNKQKGWGEKTSALFAKTIFHLHNDKYPNELKIWNDAPTKLGINDSFFLPVDAVIISIFKEIKEKNWNFKNVNKTIGEHYNGTDIEIWDDLWFWGFITQNGTRNEREMGWNSNKYWTLPESDKNPKMILKIQEKADQFLTILQESTLHNNEYKT